MIKAQWIWSILSILQKASFPQALIPPFPQTPPISIQSIEFDRSRFMPSLPQPSNTHPPNFAPCPEPEAGDITSCLPSIFPPARGIHKAFPVPSLKTSCQTAHVLRSGLPLNLSRGPQGIAFPLFFPFLRSGFCLPADTCSTTATPSAERRAPCAHSQVRAGRPPRKEKGGHSRLTRPQKRMPFRNSSLVLARSRSIMQCNAQSRRPGVTSLSPKHSIMRGIGFKGKLQNI